MADISKITLPDNSQYNIKDADARTNKQDKITVNGILVGDGTGTISAAVSGTDIKTINNESILGSGNITVGGGSSLPDPTGHEGDVLAVNSQESPYWMDTSSVSGIDLVTSISSSSTDSMVPSAKAVWDALPSINYPVTSVNGETGAVVLDASDVGALPSSTTIPQGTVTSVRVQASSPLQSSVSTAQDTSLDTTISFPPQNKNTVLAGPDGSAGHTLADTPTFRALVANDIPSITKSKISDFPTIPSPADATPLMDSSTGAVGTSTDYAREDHKHPSDTNKQDKITASGILKGDGSGGVTAATGGTDYARMSDIPTVPSNIVNTITTTAGAHTAITSQKGNVSFNVPTTASHVGAIAAPSSPSSGNVLTYNGSSWVAQAPASGLPTQDATTNGKYLISNGTSGAAWNTITASSIGAQPSGSYKTTQSAKTDPTASGATTAFIDSITQNANGEITATKKNIDTQLVTEIVIEGTPSSGSSNLVTSGGIYSALSAKQDSLPSITGNNGKYLTTNGLTLSWGSVDALPGQAGNAGKYLTTNGTTASWEAAEGATVVSFDSTPQANSTNLITSGAVYTAINNIDALPSQTGNSGKVLTTNGSAASWRAVDGSPAGGSNNLITSGAVYSDTTDRINRTTTVDAADTNYTTLMARGVKLLDKTTYDAVSDWSSQLVNGSIAWCYE